MLYNTPNSFNLRKKQSNIIMKKHITTVILLLFTVSIFSQIKFEKGYIIDNSNKRTECLIKNLGWKDNPTEIFYKILKNETPKKIEISSIKEFGIINESKYIKHSMKIDFSTAKVAQMDQNRNPIWEDKTVLLKIMVEGEANLY